MDAEFEIRYSTAPNGGRIAVGTLGEGAVALFALGSLEVLASVAAGRTNAQIAKAFTVTEATVATHVHNLLTKLELSNRVEAATWWVEHRQ